MDSIQSASGDNQESRRLQAENAVLLKTVEGYLIYFSINPLTARISLFLDID